MFCQIYEISTKIDITNKIGIVSGVHSVRCVCEASVVYGAAVVCIASSAHGLSSINRASVHSESCVCA